MSARRVLITTSSFGKKDRTPLDMLEKEGFQAVLNPHGRKLTEEEVKALLSEHRPEGMIAGVEPLTDNVLSGAEGLRVISRCGIGLDNVDLKAAERLGIKVLNTPDAPTLSVAELTVGMMLGVLRNLPLMDRAVRTGQWKRPMGRLLTGKTVGLIGCGRIGSTVAHLLGGFHCKLLGYDPYRKEHPEIILTDLDTLLSESDIISIHVPFSEETENLINAGNIKRLKKGAVLINTSRGGIVDEAALSCALTGGDIRGAALDCFIAEPYRGELVNCEHVLLSCHVGSYAEEARVQMEIEAVENLLRAFGDMGRKQ